MKYRLFAKYTVCYQWPPLNEITSVIKQKQKIASLNVAYSLASDGITSGVKMEFC